MCCWEERGWAVRRAVSGETGGEGRRRRRRRELLTSEGARRG